MKCVDNYVKAVWTVERNLLAEGMTREARQINKEHRNELLEGCKIVDCYMRNYSGCRIFCQMAV